MELNWSPEAERGIISVLLQHNDAFDRIGATLSPDSFFGDIERRVYKVLHDKLTAGKQCDVISVYNDLQRDESNADIAIQDIGDLSHYGAFKSMLRQYAGIVAEKHSERKLKTALFDAMEIAGDEGIPIADRIAKVGAAIDTLAESNTKNNDPVLVSDLIPKYLDKLERNASGEKQNFVPTGIEQLDAKLGGGLRGGKVYVIAARPSVGKSSIAQAICGNAAQAGYPAAMFSQEMMNEEMLDREVSRLGTVHMRSHNQAIPDESDEYGRIVEAIERLRGVSLWFYDGAGLKLQDIAIRARTLKRKHGLMVLVVDYLQLCASINPKLSRHHQIEEISRGLKVLAKQLDIPIIILSQLNRDVEKRNPPRPISSDLKESGAIEEDADVIMLMWPHLVEDESTLIGIDVAKHRGGPKGSFGLRFTPKYQQWADTYESVEKSQAAEKKKSNYDF